MEHLSQNLVVAALMVALTVTVHFFGLLTLRHVLRHTDMRFRPQASIRGGGGLLMVAVFGIFAIHTIEIWLYAVLFFGLGALNDFESALYFSTVSFASLGYGDIVLSAQWRMVGAIEAANGLILFAWSTAFLMSVMTRVKALAHDWDEG